MLFLAGITLLIGAQKTVVFFFKRGKLRGTVCFLGGMLMVLFKWPVIGMLVELFGIINLFGFVEQTLLYHGFAISFNHSCCRRNFFPVVVIFLRRVPVVGHVLDLPLVSKVPS